VASQKEQNKSTKCAILFRWVLAPWVADRIAVAMHGYGVTACDLSSDVLRDAAAKVRAYVGALVDKKRLTPSASTEALSRVTFTRKTSSGTKSSIAPTRSGTAVRSGFANGAMPDTSHK
jgi:hypothetical protein